MESTVAKPTPFVRPRSSAMRLVLAAVLQAIVIGMSLAQVLRHRDGFLPVLIASGVAAAVCLAFAWRRRFQV